MNIGPKSTGKDTAKMAFFSLCCVAMVKMGYWRKDMSLSRIPRMDGLKAANHWLAHLEPAKEAKRRKRYTEFQQEIEAALRRDKKLLIAFREVLEIARWLGRVDGLGEGLKLYEYGLRIQEDKPPAFRAVMKYAVNNPHNVSAPEICDYLDKEILRIEELKTAAVRIRPPEQWRCQTWREALKRKRNNVDVFFNDAKDEAFSEKFATLMAWATWGQQKHEKVPAGKPKE